MIGDGSGSASMRRPLGTTAVLAATAMTIACASRGASGDPGQCAPVDGLAINEPAVLRGLAGEYRLILVATTGANVGTTVGRLTLHDYAGELRRMMRPDGAPMDDVLTPYFGAMDIDLEAVGAVRVGDAMSVDSLRPGVLFVQQNIPATMTPSSITMRVGSLANRRRAAPTFDGGYMALRVRSLTAESLVGFWASGVTTERASGHFCAFRDAA